MSKRKLSAFMQIQWKKNFPKLNGLEVHHPQKTTKRRLLFAHLLPFLQAKHEWSLMLQSTHISMLGTSAVRACEPKSDTDGQVT
jgi:hypothetical protein